ncbi:MAG: ABC transporter ATP-binding protein [Planctomycetota bacterium]|nr:ABC transporter ATP-binding protein [Planctomycetota bacterium]
MPSAADNGPQTTDQCVVRAQHLCKRYELEAETREILKDVSLALAAGQSLAIMGPSGSGKTTLLNIIGTLDTPTSGEVSILGSNPFALAERELALFRNTTIGFIFQAHHLLPQCSVVENVLLPAIVRKPVARRPEGARGGIGHEAAAGQGEDTYGRALRLLERVGLKARLHDRPARLSGGERQRAAVVRALINAPQVVLADEPTGSLDHASAENIGALLSELKREESVALIIVTHTLDLARRMDSVMQLRDGVLVPA